MAEQYRDSSQVARRLVDERSLCLAKRGGAIFMHIETNGSNPLINQPGASARAEMAHVIDPAWEDKIVGRPTATIEPCQQRLARRSSVRIERAAWLSAA